jgi:hypothetical protein
MESAVDSKPALSTPGFGASRGWWVVLGALAFWHALLTLALFGPDQQAFTALTDDHPIISGRHALHLYHGFLGARVFREGGRSVAIDASFCAGYPKTPWFDTGSKPAELFLLAGAKYQPAAYKIGLVCTWALLPLMLALAARAAGFNRGAACITAFFTMAVCWSDCGRERLWAGDLDLILASALGILALGLALLYHRTSNPLVWLALTLAAWAVCFFQVLVLLALLPLALLFYFGYGWQHRLLWHLGLLATGGLAFGGNWFWLRTAFRFWWIRSEPETATTTNSLVVLDQLVQHQLLSQPMLLGLLIALAVAAVIGIVVMSFDGRAVAGRILAVGLADFLVMGLFSDYWRLHTSLELGRFLFTALVLATLPAAQCVVSAFDGMARLTGTNLRGATVTCALITTIVIGCHMPLGQFARHTLRQERLPLGLTETAQSDVELIQKQTTPDARLLWEETPANEAWSPLLPLLTGRAFVGGLGSEATIEHAAIRLTGGGLAGRPLSEWTDSELADYCRRYNVGWVACRSPASLERFGKSLLIGEQHELPGGGRLLTLRRPHSYILAGKGKVARVEHNLITLTDLVPSDGVIVLSFHYHPGIIPSADRVRIEKEPQLHGAISFIRLRLAGPIARLTLRWGEE